MNPLKISQALSLVEKEHYKNVIIASPFIFLKPIREKLKKAKLAAQDLFYEKQGAFTGQVSSWQLKFLGVDYVIVGHSEKRSLGDDDLIVNKKIRAAFEAKLIPILCVGEPLVVRKKGLKAVKNFVKNQLIKNLKNISQQKNKKLLLAYEPIWAIGKGYYDLPFNASLVLNYLKNVLVSKFSFQKIFFLYGGSVNHLNAKDFLNQKEIDGLLVGQMSLKGEMFKKIIQCQEN